MKIYHITLIIFCRRMRKSHTFRMRTSRAALMSSGIRLLMNQLSHRIPLSNPIILMVSFRRASFSYTMPLIMMATEYIQASVMKSGIERLITRKNLHTEINTETNNRQGSNKRRQKTAKLNFNVKGENLHIIDVTRVRHLLDVNASSFLASCQSPDNPVFNNVL